MIKPFKDTIYIPSNLKKMMDIMMEQPLTFVCAGTGFGKTTVVSNYLEKINKEVNSYWYICFGESSEKAWEGISKLISMADNRVGEYLSKLSLPTVNNLGYISSLMGQLSCDEKTVLVIDNYHFAEFPAPYRLLDALAMHKCKKLHIVVLSHPLYLEEGIFTNNPRIYSVSQAQFCFDKADIQKLFYKNSASINEEEAEHLYKVTEGWVAALRLHLTCLLSDGMLSWSLGINELMERSFWTRLNEEQKQLFLGVSLLDTFNEAQAIRMLGIDVISNELWSSVRDNAFVRKSSDEYILHTLLKEFLDTKFKTQSESNCRKMYARAGQACIVQGKNMQAISFFVKAERNLDALSVPITSVELAEFVRTKSDEFNQLLTECRVEALEGRWLLLLGTAVKASLNDKTKLARTALTRLSQLSQLDNLKEDEKQCIFAALEMADSFRAYNDIKKMSQHHMAAIDILDEPKDFYITNDSWSFCIPSVTYMFWNKSGSLDDNIKHLCESIPLYAILSGGKGLGAAEAMAAEAALLAGETEKSITNAYIARTIAAKANQDSILFCVYTTLAKASLLNDDMKAFKNSIDLIKELAFKGKEYLCVTTSEVALGLLFSLIDVEEELPSWMLVDESTRDTLYPISVPFAHIVTLRYIRKHKPKELIGIAEAYIREADELHHLLPKLYFLLEQARWFYENDQYENALEKTKCAIYIALPDHIILPFAQYYVHMPKIVEKALEEKYQKYLRRIQNLGRKFEIGAAHARAIMGGVFPLTSREREIAILAQKNFSTKKIAEQLNISPATVKNTLSKVYSKLDVSGKSDLEGIIL